MLRTVAFIIAALVVATSAETALPGNEDVCEVCYELISQAYNELIQAIIQVGVLDGCGDVCGLLPDSLEADACDIVCSIVGIDEFIKVIENSDPDPIYICELFDLCAIVDNGAVSISSFTVNPQAGPAGTTFNFMLDYTVINATGTGEMELVVFPPGSYYEPFGTGGLIYEIPPGSYQQPFSIDATPAESEPFLPGVYPALVMICNGECGSTHPHSEIYAQAEINFTITGH